MAQKNDFTWWREAWGDAMVAEHRGEWATRFAGWVQHILDSKDSNAFHKFMYDEHIVCSTTKALAVPSAYFRSRGAKSGSAVAVVGAPRRDLPLVNSCTWNLSGKTTRAPSYREYALRSRTME